MSKLFPDEPSPQELDARPGALHAVAAVHGAAGAYVLYRSVAERFDGPWALAVAGAAILLISALGLAFRRRRFDHALSRFLVFVFRVGGGLTLIVGALAMREHMDGAWPVMGVSLGIAGWGGLFGKILDHCEGAFHMGARPGAVPLAARKQLTEGARFEGAQDALLARLTERAGQTAAGFRRGGTLIGALFAGMALLCGAAMGQWAIAGVVGGFGAGIFGLAALAVRRTSPARMAPVLTALRDAPERIAQIRHYTTGDSGRMFQAHWIEVKTETHRLVVEANHDWETVLDHLARRCPAVRVQR